MKSYFILSCALLLGTTVAVQANPITRAEARQVAQQLVGIDDSSTDAGAPLSPFYVFSRGAGQGFVIVSGDDSTAPILGYTEQGDYDLDKLPPQLQTMLRQWDERIGDVQRRPQPQRQRLSAPRRAIADYKKEWTSVAPLLKTHWHQDYPYNMLAPVKQGVGRCLTGCVATAGSQVTYYFHKDNPTELAYDTPTYSYGTPITVSLPKGTSIDWNLMKLSGTGTAQQDSAVAKLMYALGTSAWLTYGDGDGTATSGHNDKMAEAMKGHFKLNYSYKAKSSSTQQAWEELIYKNLATRRPMLYSGAKEDGGHSVCLDGYQASTGLYHFNFGWGGQGDGYYTVDDATGMNGFNTYQDLVYNITPQVQSLEGEALTDSIFQKAASEVQVSVTNSGTLDYQGIYIYVNKRLTATGTAAATDTKTVLEPGKSVTMTFTVNTVQKDSAYLIVSDKTHRIISSKMIKITPTVADLHLSNISVDAGMTTTTVDGMDFRRVNNSAATVTVTLTNGADGTYCQPNLQCFLQKYDADKKSWTDVKSVIQNTYTFDAGQTRAVNFVFLDLDEGEYYRAYLNNKAVASAQTEIAMDTDDTYTYFTVQAPDLDVVVDGRTATVTGHWNATLFAKKATDASICSYDIAGLDELNEKPAAPNPNALFFTVSKPTQKLDGIDNVVVDGVCEHLRIQTAADFMPMRPFTARQASFTLTEAEPGKWHGALIPFAFEVPYGMQMKQASEYTTKGLATVSHLMTRNVEPMTVATFLTSRPDLNTLTATDVEVTTATSASFFDGLLRAATVSTPIEDKALVLGEYINSLYFVAPAADQTTLDAFMPTVVGATAQRVRTTAETLADGYYRSLSATIASAYEALGENPAAPAAARKALTDEMKVAEDLLTYRSHEAETDVKNENSSLENAVKAFLEAAASTPAAGDVNGDGTVDVADIAAIIDVMASATIPDASASGAAGDSASVAAADVNGDGTVDVADIATVIDIMASATIPDASASGAARRP